MTEDMQTWTGSGSPVKVTPNALLSADNFPLSADFLPGGIPGTSEQKTRSCQLTFEAKRELLTCLCTGTKSTKHQTGSLGWPNNHQLLQAHLTQLPDSLHTPNGMPLLQVSDPFGIRQLRFGILIDDRQMGRPLPLEEHLLGKAGFQIFEQGLFAVDGGQGILHGCLAAEVGTEVDFIVLLKEAHIF